MSQIEFIVSRWARHLNSSVIDDKSILRGHKRSIILKRIAEMGRQIEEQDAFEVKVA